MLEKLLAEIILAQPQTKTQLEKIKRTWGGKNHCKIPQNSEILKMYRKEKNSGNIQISPQLEKLLKTKTVRTISGVTPVAIFTKPYPCPGKCVYCPSYPGMPKSYIPDEPAIMRASDNEFDPQKQILSRLRQYQNVGHPTDKIELIIKGATWSAYPQEYQQEFIKKCFETCNQQTSTSLEKAQRINETANYRLIGINIETRPDLITPEEILRLRSFGITRVELGVQTIFDDILKKIKRGHGKKEIIRATWLLKQAGFKIGYHLMPNLPGSNFDRDLAMFTEIFKNPDFQPDMLKIYPCVVTPYTNLADWFRQGKYQTYPQEELINLLIEIKKIIPLFIRIDRLGRDIPVHNLLSGFTSSNIREIVQQKMAKEKNFCQCIRCREIRGEENLQSPEYKELTYGKEGNLEYFLSWEDESRGEKRNKLLALLRLRIINSQEAIVREIHTYGASLPIGESQEKVVQHKGWGKKLMEKAENICRQRKIKKLKVISGIGVRHYYRKLGYELEETYMVKNLNS